MIFNERQLRFHEGIRHEWNDDVTVQAWRKWSEPFFVSTRAATDAIVKAARLQAGMKVIDIASGSGEPAMAVAAAVGPTGHVTATDLGAGMLVSAEQNARTRGLTNLTYKEADVHELPFGDAAFDRVTCRFGIMYFVNLQRALSEIQRVLKPEGRAAFVAWGGPDQPYFNSTVKILFSHLPAPPPPPEPDKPSPFKFAAPGSLTAALTEAGFRDVEEQALEIPWPWPGPAEQLWEQFRDVAAPFRPMIEGFPADKRKQVFDEVLTALRAFEKDGKIEMTAKIVVGSGVR